MNIYDFDDTIYEGDSSIDFFKYCLKKHKKIWFLLPKIGFYTCLYCIKIISTKQYKEKFFSFLSKISKIEKVVEDFWKENDIKIKKWYLEKNHEKDIIISASPTFLLEPICKKLLVYDLLSTNMDPKTGEIIGENCKGKEKVKLLFLKYPDIIIEEMYTDSHHDLPLLSIAKQGFMVKGDAITQFISKS